MNFSGFQFLKFIYCNIRYKSLQKAIGLVLFFNSGRVSYFTTYSNHLVSGDASWWNSQIKLDNTISRSRRHLFYHFRWQHHMITIRQSCYKYKKLWINLITKNINNLCDLIWMNFNDIKDAKKSNTILH